MYPMQIAVEMETASRIAKEIVGQGGFQDLLRLLQAHLVGQSLEIPSRQIARKILDYTSKYGEGGFQGRLQQIAVEINRHDPGVLQ
ncbi:MAG: hypothetical protein NTW86_18920 [Candidatus Sumerlaeota bacterium]|nr:hypothetical protein [Candidatus Sumerlaeota bacterium]